MKSSKKITQNTSAFTAAIEEVIERRRITQEWEEQVKKWKEEVPKETLIFEYTFPGNTTGHWYVDRGLAKSGLNDYELSGTPIEFVSIKCYFRQHMGPNFHVGEVDPGATISLAITVRSLETDIWTRNVHWNHGNDMEFRTNLLTTYLNWPRYNGEEYQLGFASTASFSELYLYPGGWVWIFDNNKTREFLLHELEKVITTVNSVPLKLPAVLSFCDEQKIKESTWGPLRKITKLKVA